MEFTNGVEKTNENNPNIMNEQQITKIIPSVFKKTP